MAYEGDPCPSCANFTLVRSGTCLKCDTCGSITGCSVARRALRPQQGFNLTPPKPAALGLKTAGLFFGASRCRSRRRVRIEYCRRHPGGHTFGADDGFTSPGHGAKKTGSINL
jgi:hypothetical protein